MVAWTSSSGIPVQAYRTDMVAEALAVRRRRHERAEGQGAAGVFVEVSQDMVLQRFVEQIIVD